MSQGAYNTPLAAARTKTQMRTLDWKIRMAIMTIGRWELPGKNDGQIL